MTDQKYPEPTTGAFIFNPAGELLLIKSHKWPDRYVVPGGHIELGEKIEVAVVREAMEETGLEIYDLKFICFQEFINDPLFWKPGHYIFFDYQCKTNSSVVRLNDEAEDYVWVKPDLALDLPLDPYTRFALQIILKH